MTIETTTPAAETQTPAAASSDTKTAATQANAATATGTPETKGVSGEQKAPAATPDAKGKAESAAPTTLLGKKLPPPEPGKAPAEGSKDAKDGKAAEYEVALPEGSILSADHAKAMTAKYRELGLSKEQADKLAAQTDGMLKGYVESQVAKLNEVEAGWWKDLEGHPKYGGSPENLALSNTLATAALDKFFPGLKDDLVNSPYAAHPRLFGGLVELGKMIADAKFRMNGLPPAVKTELSPAQELYGVDGKGKNLASKADLK